VLIDLVQDIVDEDFPAVVPHLEVAGKVDLNGNGAIDTPGQPGTSIDTTVGQPQVT
jgi:hypothetical protein